MDAGVPDEVAVGRAQQIPVASPAPVTSEADSGEGSSEDTRGLDESESEDADVSDPIGMDEHPSPGKGEDSSDSQIGNLADATRSEQEKDEPRLTRKHRNQLERAYRNLAEGWRRGGRPQAADNLDRYLDGKPFSDTKSEPLIFSREAAREFRPIKEAEIENEQRFENRTFLARTRNEELNRKLRGLKDGESTPLPPDNWDVDYDPKRIAEDFARGETDFYFAFGRTKVKSDVLFRATRHGDQIHIEGTVSHGWNDVYDFTRTQPGGGGALALQEHRGARPFDVAAAWSRKVRGTVDIRNGELTNPRFQWTDMDDSAD
jgi:hypothetical protein